MRPQYAMQAPQYGGYYPPPYAAPYNVQPNMQPALPAAQPQQEPDGGINWVQGKAGAQAHLVTRGCSAVLMDIEEPVFYIKTVDANGTPLPLRTFDYTERQAASPAAAVPAQSQHEYALRSELEQLRAEVAALQPKKGKKEASAE